MYVCMYFFMYVRWHVQIVNLYMVDNVCSKMYVSVCMCVCMYLCITYI